MSIAKRFNCPKCKKESLSEFNTSDGVIVDFCDECFGIWFDSDELAHYIELSKDIPELDEMQKKAVKTDLVCPKCKGLLEEIPFSTKTDIMIERCPNCKGTFFDAGEIKMAEKASAELESVEERMKLVAQRFADMGFKSM